MGNFVGTLSDKRPDIALEHLENILNGFARGSDWSGDGADLCYKLGKIFHRNDELFLLRKFQSHDGLKKCECCNRSYLLLELEGIQRRIDIRADCLQELNRHIYPKKVISVDFHADWQNDCNEICDNFQKSLNSDDFARAHSRARKPDIEQIHVINIFGAPYGCTLRIGRISTCTPVCKSSSFVPANRPECEQKTKVLHGKGAKANDTTIVKIFYC